jgi:hypothetical protein
MKLRLLKILIYLASLLIICSSCAYSNLPKINEEFIKKYGNEVKKINSSRKQEDKQVVKSFLPNDKNSLQEKNFLLNQDSSYQEILVPNDAFEINYTENYPQFKKIGKEFDEIHIPDTDSYGVKTNFESDKNYHLIGNNYLQQNISNILSSRHKEDIKISEILVKEKRKAVKIRK